jgi:transcriptional regulator with XRE-family HTH domain
MVNPQKREQSLAVTSPISGAEMGADLRARRVALGLSQIQLSLLAGGSGNPASISRYELGLIPQRSTSTLPRIEAALRKLEREAEADQ